MIFNAYHLDWHQGRFGTARGEILVINSGRTLQIFCFCEYPRQIHSFNTLCDAVEANVNLNAEPSATLISEIKATDTTSPEDIEKLDESDIVTDAKVHDSNPERSQQDEKIKKPSWNPRTEYQDKQLRYQRPLLERPPIHHEFQPRHPPQYHRPRIGEFVKIVYHGLYIEKKVTNLLLSAIRVINLASIDHNSTNDRYWIFIEPEIRTYLLRLLKLM